MQYLYPNRWMVVTAISVLSFVKVCLETHRLQVISGPLSSAGDATILKLATHVSGGGSSTVAGSPADGVEMGGRNATIAGGLGGNNTSATAPRGGVRSMASSTWHFVNPATAPLHG